MITFSVKTDIDKAIRKLASVTEAQQLNFAVSKAINRTAMDVQAAVRQAMPQRFTLRSNWVVQGIRVEFSNKRKLEAIVYSRDRFMKLQEYGGVRHPFGNYLAIPTTLVRRTPRDKIRRADTPKGLGDKAEVVTVGRRRYLALKKRRRGRSGNELRLMYLLLPQASIQRRLGLIDDGLRVSRLNFSTRLREELAEAIARAR